VSSAFQACIRVLPRLPPILRVVLTFCAGMIAAFYFYSGSSPSSNTNLRPRITHHASRITHHASRITHHASRMHPLSLTLGCHHNQISAHTVGCGFAGHHRVWLSAAAEQQQRALRASCQRQAATVVRQSAPKQMQRSCKKLRGVRAAAASAATTCIIRQAVIQEKLQQAARVR
jgi:hypothetical protein